MSGSSTPATSTAFENSMKIATGIGIPIVVAALGGMFMWMDKIDDRQYQIQGNMVSPADLTAVEQRIVDTVDIRMGAMEKALADIAASQRRLEDQLYERRVKD